MRTLYNIQPRKTYDADFEFPDIPQIYERDFIRGFIDGDGSIGDRHFSMVCNSSELKRVIYKENRKLTPYWSLHFSYSMKVRKPIFDYLYKDAAVFLKRKRDKALDTVLNAVDKRTAQCNA